MQSEGIFQTRTLRTVLASGLVVLAAWIAAATRPTSGSAWILDSLHWSCAFCAAAWIAWRAARAASGNLRRVRQRFALGLAFLAAGQLTWDLLSWIGWNPFPGIPNLLYLLLSPCFALGFAATVGEQMPGSRWKSAVLDVAGFGLAVLAFTLALFLPHAGSRSALEFAVLTAYPVLLFSAAAAGIIVQLHLRLRPTAATLAVIGGLAGYGVLDRKSVV